MRSTAAATAEGVITDEQEQRLQQCIASNPEAFPKV